MVNWKNIDTALSMNAPYTMLTHVMCGLYLWEWVANLGFDYGLVTTKGSKWTVAVYLSCRLSGLLMVIMSFVQFDSVGFINVFAAFTATMAFAYIGMLLSSIIIALRAVAIWNRNQYVIWPIVFAFLGYCGITIFVAVGDPSPTLNVLSTTPKQFDPIPYVTSPNILVNRVNYTYGMIFDIGTLVVALIGALRYGRMTRGGLWTFIYHQGVIWILAVVITYMFPVVFLWLNLNFYMSEISLVPSALAMVTAATTMHRELYKHANSDKAVQLFKPTISGGYKLTVDHAQSLVGDVRTRMPDRQDRDSMPFDTIPIDSSPEGTPLPATIGVDSQGFALGDSV